MAMTPIQTKFHRLIRATRTFDDVFYARSNPDAVQAGRGDLLEHYIVQGEREGRQPNPFFDPRWYRQQGPKVRPEDNLLAHYLTVGDRDGLQPVPGLDPPYVRALLGNTQEPALVGFLRQRAAGRLVNPCRFFDYAFYYRTYPDVVRANIDGLWHFLRVGADEGRLPSKDFSWFLLRERYQLTGSNARAFIDLMARWRHFNRGQQAPETPTVVMLQDELRRNHRPSEQYESLKAPPAATLKRGVDVYAFYLTQFHRIPENDAWWGEGFTEWHNVVRGVPRFSGHYQPRVPSALGFYDLDDPTVMPRQIALAKQAGLAGFAFYYYHFGDRRLLERPLERFLADPSLDAGFFLIWANETWSRRWDGSEKEVLLAQKYPDDLPEILATDLVRYFDDPRYRRIDGRPLLAFYRIGEIPDAPAWIERLRAAFRALGHDPLLYQSQTFNDNDPRLFGLDGAMEFPPHKHGDHLRQVQPTKPFGSNPALEVWDYEAWTEFSLADPTPPYPLIRSCFPSWDNDARRQGASKIMHGSTPELFRRWLETLVSRAEAGIERPAIVCINAWNEWGEGAYLEPDRHFGYAYLNAVQSVLRPEARENVRRLVLVGHDAFPAGAQRLLLQLGATLQSDFAVEVAFVLLRGGEYRDGMLDQYRAVAETHVVDGDLPRILRALAQRGFAHVIVNSAASLAAVEPLAACGFTTVQLTHELPDMFEAAGARAILPAAMPHVRRFIAPTASIARMLRWFGVSDDRIDVLPQGQYRQVGRLDRATARKELLGAIDDRPLIVALGFGDLRKGLDLFVGTCEESTASDHPMLFVWQGDWHLHVEEDLAERVDALVTAGALRHLPDSTDIDRLLNAADAFFLPSREDPLPSAAIEAWSVGLPVTAIAEAGGISDFIADDPSRGTLSTSEFPMDLLAALEAGVALGRSNARADWARATFNWPTYVQAILGQLYDAPGIEVAIVGHNHGRFAEARIHSILRQTLPPTRIAYHDIASDDGSPAAVRALARKLGVTFVEEKANRGRLYETWATIASASDAEFLHLAEGDDWIAPTMFERCVEGLRAAPNAAYAFVAVEWIDAGDAILANHRAYPPSVIGAAIAEGGVVTPQMALGSDMPVKNPILSISSVVWRRTALLDLLEANRADLERLDFAFDWLLYLRAARAGFDAVFVGETLCRHRQHPESFAARGDLNRHATEIARIYAIEPSTAHDSAREIYLTTLG